MNNAKEERVTDLSIIMEMIEGKPYYSVQYRNVGYNGYNIGYSSYNLKTVLEFIDEYFEIVESDKHTNADRIRSMSDEELAEWINAKNTWEQCAHEESACMKKLRVNGILRWLRSEAE